jgi:peptidoglycan hydrolase-like protein with peptidoglycan-binding domain
MEINGNRGETTLSLAGNGQRAKRVGRKIKFSRNLFRFISIYFYLFSITFFLFFTGCDQVYGVLDKKGAEEKKLVGDTIPYEENPTVKEIQTLLKIYGYNPGTPDGVLGFRTRDAIERFQKDNGLEVTRKVDARTWQLMKSLRDRGWIAGPGLNVKKIQLALKKAGFTGVVADGTMGEQTKNAIKKFQQAHGLKADGKVGYWTLKELEKTPAQ